jgi:hypothetical protein
MKSWITYIIIFIVVITGVVQIHFLNRSLSNFSSKEVIPTNFVLFTTCSIIGSSVLYHDLTRTSPLALFGIVCMFGGVYIVTRKDEMVQSEADATETIRTPVTNNHYNIIVEDITCSPKISSSVLAVPESSENTPLLLDSTVDQRLSSSASSIQIPQPPRRNSFLVDLGSSSIGSESAIQTVSLVLGTAGTQRMRQMELDFVISRSPRQ